MRIRKDWRKVEVPRSKHPYLVVRWYHWARYPRLAICYLDTDLNEMRDMKIDWRRAFRGLR